MRESGHVDDLHHLQVGGEVGVIDLQPGSREHIVRERRAVWVQG